MASLAGLAAAGQKNIERRRKRNNISHQPQWQGEKDIEQPIGRLWISADLCSTTFYFGVSRAEVQSLEYQDCTDF